MHTGMGMVLCRLSDPVNKLKNLYLIDVFILRGNGYMSNCVMHKQAARKAPYSTFTFNINV